MVYRMRTKGRLSQAQPPAAMPAAVPASVGGINALNALNQMPPEDCVYAYNLMPVEYGQELRKGYREWATGLGGNDVRTILNYESNKAGLANDRLWGVTSEGIYNITNFGETAPVQDVAFADQTDPAGYGVKCEFTADNGDHYMFYADGKNGIWQYNDGTGLWSQPTSGTNAGEWSYQPPGGGALTGFPVEDVVFVMLHKQRIWVILEDSDDAWYLPVAAIAGELKRFQFGTKMPRGGRLMGLWNWTVDGGDGVDDYLVAIDRAGDVALYRGEDPELGPGDTTNRPWENAGIWYIGDMTASRRPVIEYGKEMYILSSFGLTNLEDLLRGAATYEERNSPSAKITRFLRRDVIAGLAGYEWSLQIHPADGFLQIITPEPSNTPFVQYVQNLTTKAWGLWENVPMISAEEWNGSYFMGGLDGKVYIYDGNLDGTDLAGDNAGEPIGFRGLTSFQVYGNSHSTFKQCGIIRPVGVVAGSINLNVEAVYDYNVNAIIAPPTVLAGTGTSLWNSAVWNADLWGAGLTGQSIPVGALGIGRAIAIGFHGSASERISIISWDITVVEGNFL